MSDYKPSRYDGTVWSGGVYGVWRPPVKRCVDFSGYRVYQKKNKKNEKVLQLGLPI